MSFDGSMLSDHFDPCETLQPRTIGTGADLWGTSKDLTTGPLLTDCGTVQGGPATRKENACINFMPPFGITTPTTHDQASNDLLNYVVDSNGHEGFNMQFLPLYNEPLPSHSNEYLEAVYQTGQQGNEPQPTLSMIIPNRNNMKASLANFNGGNLRYPNADSVSIHTIGYVCDEEDKDYVFKCGEFSCYDRKFGRWSDLKRHYEGTHAVARRVTFWCEVQGCERSKAFGYRPFPRKDKLGDHVRKVHQDSNEIMSKF